MFSTPQQVSFMAFLVFAYGPSCQAFETTRMVSTMMHSRKRQRRPRSCSVTLLGTPESTSSLPYRVVVLDNQEISSDHSCISVRRRFLGNIIGAASFLVASSSSSLSSSAAHAVVIQNNNPQQQQQQQQSIFQAGKELTVEQALERFRLGQESLQYLLDHYDEICQEGGDNVRRYLGTVGFTSGLYGISKVLKTLKTEADDIVEFSELSEELMAAINQADGSSYMAIFTTTSTSGVPPQKYFDDAKIEVKRAKQVMNELSKQLKL